MPDETQRLGMFPLSTVLFPGGQLPLHVFEPRYLTLTADCLGQDREFGVVMISRGSETGGGDERVDTGTAARIDRGSQLPDNRLFLEVRGVRRVRSLLSEMGDVPALPHDLDLGDQPEEVAWRLCTMAPLNLMDRQHLLETDDPELRMRSLAELCDAMASDVTGLLSGGPGED